MIANSLNDGLKDLKGLITPKVLDGNSHAYYIYGLKLNLELIKVKREIIVSALEAEGLKGLINGYANIHLLPIFQKKIAYGSKGFPWSSDICSNNISYLKGICPVAEKLNDKEFLGFEMCLHNLSEKDVKLVIDCFRKVWDNLDSL